MARGRPRKPKTAPPPPRDVTKDDNTKLLGDILADIERIQKSMASEQGVYMASCKRNRELINGHLKRASDAGFDRKAIKEIIKTRELERKIENIREKLNEDDRLETYEDYRRALGDFADTPLGAASAPAKQDHLNTFVGDDDDDDRDLRPSHLRQNDADRVAEANAKAIEDGIKPLPN